MGFWLKKVIRRNADVSEIGFWGSRGEQWSLDTIVLYTGAGSYTPWLTLKSYHQDGWSIQLSWIIWIWASLGILYQQMFHERYKWLETTIYVTIALAPSLAVFEMVSPARPRLSCSL